MYFTKSTNLLLVAVKSFFKLKKMFLQSTKQVHTNGIQKRVVHRAGFTAEKPNDDVCISPERVNDTLGNKRRVRRERNETRKRSIVG